MQQTLIRSTRSLPERLISGLSTLYTATACPLYTAGELLGDPHAIESFTDNVEIFPELFPTYTRLYKHIHDYCFRATSREISLT